MARMLAGLIVALLTTLFLGIGGEENLREKRQTFGTFGSVNLDEIIEAMCKNNPFANQIAICAPYLTSSTTSTSTMSTTTPVEGFSTMEPTTSTTTDEIETTTKPASVLERATWCRFMNGSYASLGQTFIHDKCKLCQCTPSRVFRCAELQCMATYCIDGSTPSPKDGQCCSQCAYESRSDACVINGITIPHGTVLRKTGNNIQCWCQLGMVECRKGTATLFSGMDAWGEGSAVYVVVIVICVLLIVGTLLCLGCAIYFYYYYKRNQQAAQEAYDQYYGNAGWQPVNEDGLVADANGEDKQAEAEQSQAENAYPTGNDEHYVPPPYAIYNGSYAYEQK